MLVDWFGPEKTKKLLNEGGLKFLTELISGPEYVNETWKR
jgi:hypothetical protein